MSRCGLPATGSLSKKPRPPSRYPQALSVNKWPRRAPLPDRDQVHGPCEASFHTLKRAWAQARPLTRTPHSKQLKAGAERQRWALGMCSMQRSAPTATSSSLAQFQFREPLLAFGRALECASRDQHGDGHAAHAQPEHTLFRVMEGHSRVHPMQCSIRTTSITQRPPSRTAWNWAAHQDSGNNAANV